MQQVASNAFLNRFILVAPLLLLGVPLLSILCFLLLWGNLAPKVQTSLGAIPGPAQVWTEAVNLHEDAVQKAESKAKFEAQVAELNERRIEQGREPVERLLPVAVQFARIDQRLVGAEGR
mgnify:CR=1 FL=1